MKVVLGSVSAIALVFGIGWVITDYDLIMQRYFAPKYEQLRRETTEQSQSYVEGQRRQIGELRMEYIGATPEKKAAIRSFALHQINGLPESALTADILSFREQLISGN